MIRPLRSRHRTMIVALAVITPALFAAGLAVRQSVPPADAAEVEKLASHRDDLDVIREDGTLGQLPLRTIWLRGPGERRALTLELEGPAKRPDLLAYWEDRPAGDESLSEDARLLGAVGGRPSVTWDVATPSASGRLAIYSTAWKRVVGSAAPPSEWTTAP